MQAGVIVAIVFAILVSVFALQNAQPVDINFLTLHGEASLALVILISVAVGAVILGMLNLYSRLKSGKSIKKITRDKDAVDRENTDLKGQVSALKQQVQTLEAKLQPRVEPVEPEQDVLPHSLEMGDMQQP